MPRKFKNLALPLILKNIYKLHEIGMENITTGSGAEANDLYHFEDWERAYHEWVFADAMSDVSPVSRPCLCPNTTTDISCFLDRERSNRSPEHRSAVQHHRATIAELLNSARRHTDRAASFSIHASHARRSGPRATENLEIESHTCLRSSEH